MTRRALPLLLAVLATAISATPGATLDPDARVAGMKAIERVYWNHRIWPAANQTRKPGLEAVLPDDVIRQHAQDVIERSVELEQRWDVRITSAMLQAEVERMARETRNPAMLRELFDVLDNDPQLIAECLARPILVDRLWTYVHAHAHAHASKTPASETPASEPLMSDTAPVDMSSFAPDSAGLGRVPDLPQSGSCTPDTWSGPLQKVASRRMSHSAVWTGTEMIVWGGDSEGTTVNTGGRYNPATDSWTVMSPTNAPPPSNVHSAVWTGTEMVVWGTTTWFAVGGARYNPSSDSWRSMSQTNAPVTAGGQTLLWTGSKILVWGGYDNDTGRETDTGGIYDPSADTWIATSLVNAPSARQGQAAVWTGSRMIVWSGRNYDPDAIITTEFSDGGSFDPVANAWTPISTVNAPTPRTDGVAVWTGSKMVVWGGVYEDPSQNTTDLQEKRVYEIWNGTR